MKSLQGFLGLLILVGGVAILIQYLGTTRLDREVGRQGEKIDQVAQRSAEISEAVGTQGKLLEATRTDIERQEARIVELERRATETEAAALALKAEIGKVQEGAEQDRSRLGKLEAELKAVEARGAQQARELQDLRQLQHERDQDIERRLRELEKKAGLPDGRRAPAAPASLPRIARL